MNQRLSKLSLLALPIFVWAACSADADSASGANDAGRQDNRGGNNDSGSVDNEDDDGGDGILDPDGGSSQPDGGGTVVPTADGGTIQAGNTKGSCKSALPKEAQPLDTSKPTTVVGTGTSASCTFAALKNAVQTAGIVTFNCGSTPVAIAVTETLKISTSKDTVIDGGGKITLDGKSSVRIMSFDSPGWQTNDRRLTLQHIALINGKTTPTEAIPTRPAPCSQGFNDGAGGGLYVRDGNVSIVDSVFANNQGAPSGPDTGGGGIYIQGSKNGIVISKSTFQNNKASNGAGLGCLFANMQVYDSLFSGNVATGHDANGVDAKKCAFINNDQNETGSGGNGGALYSDGVSTAQIPVNITVCGDAIENNAAGTNAFGGGIFFTSNNMGGTLSIADSVLNGNTGGHWTVVSSGTVKNAGTAVGTNAKSITIANSSVQGVP